MCLLMAAACFFLGAGATVVDVGLRLVVGQNLSGVIETTTLFVGLGALLSMPVCYARNKNIAARLLSELLPDRYRYPLGIFGAVFVVGYAFVMAWITISYALDKWGGPETTQDLQLPLDILLVVVAVTFTASALGAIAGLIGQFRGD